MCFCQRCGKELEDNVVVCDGCGQAVQNGQPVQYVVRLVAPDAPSRGVGVLSFFLPLIGLILYVAWQGSTPLKAKSALKGALWGILAYVVAVVAIFAIIYFATYMSAVSNVYQFTQEYNQLLQ